MRVLPVLLLTCLLTACGSNLRPAPAVTIVAETPATTVAVQPSPQPSSTPTQPLLTSCPGTPPIQLILQERGQVVDDNESLNLRGGPGTDYNVLLRIESGEVFFVVGGPACADGYTWFQVKYDSQTGWIAEGDLTEYYVVPYLPG